MDQQPSHSMHFSRTLVRSGRYAWWVLSGLCAVGASFDALALPPPILAAGQLKPHGPVPKPKQVKEADRIYGQLLKDLGQIKTLTMFLIVGNFTDAESRPRTMKFPPPRHPKKGQEDDTPQSVLQFFNLDVELAL